MHEQSEDGSVEYIMKEANKRFYLKSIKSNKDNKRSQ